ncbi:MAG: hypothetical protein ABI615_02000 [Chthoniobacterales bacterium]
MMRRVFQSFVFIVASSASLMAQVLTFQAAGKPVVIPDSGQRKIVTQIERIVLSANFNSRDNPAAGFPDSRWTDLKDLHSYLHVSYPKEKKFETVGGDINATDIWIEIKDKKQKGILYPGPITLVGAGDSRIRLSMESGVLMGILGRDLLIYPHLPPEMQKSLDGDTNTQKPHLK